MVQGQSCLQFAESVAYRGGMDAMSSESFQSARGVEDWKVRDDTAVAVFETGDFATGAALFARIADLAEAADHHPDVEVTYPTVRVTLTTHSAGGLTDKDVALARKISAAAEQLGIDAGTA